MDVRGCLYVCIVASLSVCLLFGTHQRVSLQYTAIRSSRFHLLQTLVYIHRNHPYHPSILLHHPYTPPLSTPSPSYTHFHLPPPSSFFSLCRFVYIIFARLMLVKEIERSYSFSMQIFSTILGKKKPTIPA